MWWISIFNLDDNFRFVKNGLNNDSVGRLGIESTPLTRKSRFWGCIRKDWVN